VQSGFAILNLLPVGNPSPTHHHLLALIISLEISLCSPVTN
jgi:hypothetical protein